MQNKRKLRNDFIKIVRDVEKDFPELDLKIRVNRERVTFLNSP